MSAWRKLLSLWHWCLGVRKEVKQKLTPAGNPLPEVIHQVLQPGDLGPGRLIIVGDVHGCFDTLVELLKKLQYQPRNDNLILVGDLVDKGPKSQQVVAAVRAWCESSCCWVVRGNHDDAALAAGTYLLQGGNQADLSPKFSWVNELLAEDVEFLTQLPFSLEIPGYHILVVHAALIPGISLEQQDLAVLTKVRDLVQTPDGGWIGLEEPQENSQPWAQCWQGPHHIFFGHDARRNLQTAAHATGLDTGCVYGRQLTACVLPPLSTLLADTDAVKSSLQNGRSKGSNQHAPGDMSSQPGEGLPVAPTLAELRGELHSVPSGFLYDKKAAKVRKKAARLLKKEAKH